VRGQKLPKVKKEKKDGWKVRRHVQLEKTVKKKRTTPKEENKNRKTKAHRGQGQPMENA